MKISELRKMVRQVIKEAGVSGGVAGHTGAHGNDIDDFTSGPFKADGNVTVPLRHQVDSSKEKRNQIIPQPEQNWEDIDTNLEYDKVPDYAGSSFVNDTNDFKIIDWAYEYDIVDEPRKGKEWTNNTNEFKLFGEGVSKKKKIIKEVSTTVGGSGKQDDLNVMRDRVQNAETLAVTKDTELADAVEVGKQAERNLDTHKEEEPQREITVTQNVTTYTAAQQTSHLYYDTANHPGVIYNGATQQAFANKGTTNKSDLKLLRNVIETSNGQNKENTLQVFDNNYGTAKTPAVPNWYIYGGKGGNTAFGAKQRGAAEEAMAAGGSIQVRNQDGARIGSNPDWPRANEVLQPNSKVDGIAGSKNFESWAKANGHSIRKGPKFAENNNLIFSLWRKSLGDQDPDDIDFTQTSKVEGDAFEFTNSNGIGRIIPGVTSQETKTVSNPEWGDWNTQLDQLEQLWGAARLGERNARLEFDSAANAFRDLKQKMAEMERERDLSFSGMGAAASRGKGKSYGKGNIATGKGGKGRTLKGRRSKTTGGTRGGVPSLAALSGMKAVKGKGKGKKGKDDE